MAETETALIEIRQLPIIAERLHAVKAEIEAAVTEAESMVCTPETVQAVKTRRAELRKSFDALEEQRKAVKRAVLAPYDDFEKVYKECVSDPMKRGDAALKRTVDDYETDLKKACEVNLREYFEELKLSRSLGFLTFERAMALTGMKIAMTDAYAKTPKRLMTALKTVINNVDDDVTVISEMQSDQAVEVMAEYQANGCNLSAAIRTVQEREARRKAAQESAEARKAQKAVEAEAVAKVDTIAPPEIIEPTPLYTITFTIKDVTKAQALAVREFLKQEGIRYE